GPRVDLGRRRLGEPVVLLSRRRQVDVAARLEHRDVGGGRQVVLRYALVLDPLPFAAQDLLGGRPLPAGGRRPGHDLAGAGRDLFAEQGPGDTLPLETEKVEVTAVVTEAEGRGEPRAGRGRARDTPGGE